MYVLLSMTKEGRKLMKKKGTNWALIPVGLPRTRVIFCLGFISYC